MDPIPLTTDETERLVVSLHNATLRESHPVGCTHNTHNTRQEGNAVAVWCGRYAVNLQNYDVFVKDIPAIQVETV